MWRTGTFQMLVKSELISMQEISNGAPEIAHYENMQNTRSKHSGQN